MWLRLLYLDKMNICDEWRKSPKINPRTNRAIKLHGPTYLKLERECGPIKKRESSPKREASPRKSLPKRETKRESSPKRETKRKPSPKREAKRESSPKREAKRESSPKREPTKCPESSCAVHQLSDRTRIKRKMIKKLASLPNKQFDICMSGPRSAFRSSLVNTTLIGRGTFGEVYLANIANERVVIKEAYLTNQEQSVMMAGVKGSDNIGKVPKSSYPFEYALLSFVNDILDSHQSQNFLYTYDLAVCQGCKILADPSKAPKFCYVTFMEAADYDMTSISQRFLTEADAYNFLFQILLALTTLHQTFGIYHNDLKAENILVKNIPAGGYFEYRVGGRKYFIENRGVILHIADFGASLPYKPKYLGQINSKLTKGHQNLGTRNAMVAIDASGVEYWRPITCKYSLDHGKKSITTGPPAIRQSWIDATGKIVKSTYNQCYVGIDLQPNIPINLDDTATFPPFEFGLDVSDAFRLLVGGKRTSQRESHPGLFPPTMPLSAIRTIAAETMRVWGGTPRPVYGTVKNVRADLMLRDIYDSIQPTLRPTRVIDTFTL